MTWAKGKHWKAINSILLGFGPQKRWHFILFCHRYKAVLKHRRNKDGINWDKTGTLLHFYISFTLDLKKPESILDKRARHYKTAGYWSKWNPHKFLKVYSDSTRKEKTVFTVEYRLQIFSINDLCVCQGIMRACSMDLIPDMFKAKKGENLCYRFLQPCYYSLQKNSYLKSHTFFRK